MVGFRIRTTGFIEKNSEGDFMCEELDDRTKRIPGGRKIMAVDGVSDDAGLVANVGQSYPPPGLDSCYLPPIVE